MPNSTAYPKIINNGTAKPEDKKSAAKKTIVTNVYLGGDAGQPVATTVSFNKETESNCVYSITFDFAWNKTYKNVPFDSSSLTFSYIAQDAEDKNE